MKKIFIALSVLATLTLGIGSALAVPGVPDKVPGSDFVAPFLVSTDRVDVTINSGATTAYNLSEVRGSATDLHFYFFTTKSVLVYSVWVPITHWGTIMLDVGLLIRDMDPTNRAKLEMTVNGVTSYAGYIYAENHIWVPNPAAPGALMRVRGTTDNVLGSLYFLDLANGKSGASTIPMKEFFTRGLGVNKATAALNAADLTMAGSAAAGWTIPAANNNFYARWAITGYGRTPNLTTGLMPVLSSTFDTVLVDLYNNYERWSPMALATATRLVNGNALPITSVGGTATTAAYQTPAAAVWFRMFPEYYMLDASGETTFVLWQNGLPNGTTFHVYVINNEENYNDITITIDELTFIDARDTVPDGLKVTYPYFGAYNLDFADSSSATSVSMWAEALGWNWQTADNGATSASTNWQVLKEMARDVGTTGATPFPNHAQ